MRKALLMVLLLAASSYALDVPDITRRVTDLTQTLSSQEISQLEAKLQNHERESSDQIAIVMINSLEGNALEQFSLKICEKWKGGQRGKDNGLLILVVKNDRQIRLETGYGFEGVLPDGRCGRIIREDITPSFKEGNYYRGLDNGLDQIFLAVKGEYKGNEGDGAGEDAAAGKMMIGLFLLFFVFIVSVVLCGIKRLFGGIAGGLGTFLLASWIYTLPIAILSGIIGFLVGMVSNELLAGIGSGNSGSWSSGRGGSSSGGSGWGGGGSSFSGGGGSFGGGGASGRW